MDHDIIEQAFRDYSALRQPGTDPELEAVRIAVLLEDIFEVTLSDAEIDPAVLTDPRAVVALVARLQGSV